MVNPEPAVGSLAPSGIYRLGQGLALVTDRVAAIFGRISGVLILLSSLVIVVDIAFRLAGHPTQWGQDTTVYILVFFVFLSLAYGLKMGAHINVDFVIDRMNPRMRELMSIISSALTLVFAAIFSRYVFLWALKSIQTGDHGSGLMTYILWPAKLTAAIGIIVLALMALRLLISKCYTFYSTRAEARFGRGISNPWVTLPVFGLLLGLGFWAIIEYPILGVFGLLLVLLASGTPIGFSIGIVAIISFFFNLHGERTLLAAPGIPWDFVTKYTLVSLPLFIFAGNLMARGGLGQQLFKVASAWVGHLPGGLGIATVIACAIFAAISGSSAANTICIGAIAYPALVSHGYSKKLAAGLIASSAGLGILIPPSNAFITYGVITDVSIGQLFMAGLVPGVAMTILLIVAVALVTRLTHQFQPMAKVSWKERLGTTKSCIWVLLMPVIVLGGIYGGLTTVTEAAAVSVAYALIFSLLSRQVKISDITSVMGDSTKSVAFLMLIIMCAIMMAHSVTMLQLPDKLGTFLAASNIPPWAVVVIFMAFVMFLGCFLEGAAIILLTVPITTPILESMGFSLVWYAVLLTINIELAFITPPVGLNVFIMQHIAQVPSSTVYRGTIIFGGMILLTMILVGLVPSLALWLPSTMTR